MNKIEKSAFDFISEAIGLAIRLAVLDDEDERFSRTLAPLVHKLPCDHIGYCPDQLAALELAVDIKEWIEENAGKILVMIMGKEEADRERQSDKDRVNKEQERDREWAEKDRK